MWRFKALSIGDPERDPHEVEFFNLTGIAEAVVREFIQNSMDAKCDEKVIIRVTFENTSKEKSNEFFEQLESHLKTSNFYTENFESEDKIPFLALEDFGTTGLDGKTGEEGDFPGGKNNFYNFWWWEGKSGKTGKERGRWGLGKTTFHAASKIRSFWGLTIRKDDKRKLLMGKSLLKTHKINSKTFTYNGYFTDEGYKPYTSEIILKQFVENFGLLRDGEPGLSLVIPFPHVEITPTDVLKSIMIHYFYPILNGSLEILIRHDGEEEELNLSNFIEKASQQNWNGTSWDNVDVVNLLKFINGTSSKPNLVFVSIENPEHPEITKDSFSDQIDTLRESFNAGEIISIRVPVRIAEVGKKDTDTYFEVFIQKKQDNMKADEYYVRSGITITDIKKVSSFPIRSLFLAEDDAIAKFLGDCETPAHTDWNERTEGFTEKYDYGRRKLRFIKKGISSIISYIYLPPKELKTDFLKDIFYVNINSEDEKNKEEDETGKVREGIPEPRPRKYQMVKIDGGFRLTNNKNKIIPPLKIRIICAYDTRKGNPFKNYELYDFDLSSSALTFNSTGCIISMRKANRIELIIEDNEFELKVTGFDRLRDLVVDIKEED